MKIIQSKDTSNSLINYIDDGAALYAVFVSKSAHRLAVFDNDTFEKLDVFDIGASINKLSTPCVDDTCVYFATHDGRVVGVDKFSGEILLDVSIGMSILSDMFVRDGKLFCLGGLPITHKHKIDIDKYCLCVIGINSGTKLAQSQIMTGTPRPMTVGEDVAIINGSELFLYNAYCELKHKATLVISEVYAPVITDRFIACASKSGAIQIFNKSNLSLHGKLFIRRNVSPMGYFGGDKVYWAAGKTSQLIDLDSQQIDSVLKLKNPAMSTTNLAKRVVYVGDSEGNLVMCDFGASKTNYLKVANGNLWKPLVIENHAYVASRDSLHQIEVSCEEVHS